MNPTHQLEHKSAPFELVIAQLANTLNEQSICRDRALNCVGSSRAEPAALLAERAGVTRRTGARWKRQGHIPVHQLDAIAINMGRHPAELFGELYTGSYSA